MNLLRSLVPLVIAFLARPAVPVQAGTFIVDAAGGGDFLVIQEAILAAQPGDTILVRPGTYAEAMYIGQTGSGLLVKGDGPAAAIEVQGDAYVVARISDTDPAVRLEGLTLSGTGEYGALWIQGAKAEIVNCVIRGNDGPGGCHGVGAAGQFRLSSDVLVEGCIIENNHGWESPGGLIVWQSRADIRGNVFRDNRACYGGGIEMYHCEGYGVSVIERNVFARNQADVWGGGVFNVDSSPVIRYNTFVDNGNSLKAAVWVLGGKPEIESNLIVGSYWAVYCQTDPGYPPSLPVIGNNLCWSIGEDTLSNCAPATGLQVANPLFCDTGADDFRLCADSPAVLEGNVMYGALDVGCPDCDSTPVRPARWGGVKALFRDRRRE